MHKERIKIDLIIHDLKAPLAVIENGVANLLKKADRYGSLTEKQDRVLHRVLRNTKIVQTLVDEILELGRSGKGVVDLEKVRLSDILTDVLLEILDISDVKPGRKMKRGLGLQPLQDILEKNNILLKISGELWGYEVLLDKKKIKQILRNLLLNAVKYRERSVELEIEKASCELLISVMDDGRGIPAGYHKKIFESYFQLEGGDDFSVRGHGLGLAGVMVLVEDLGGKLALESDTGKGARFVVTLPVPESEEQGL